MVICTRPKKALYIKDDTLKDDNTDLRVFLAYINDLKERTGLNTNQLLLRAGINYKIVSNINYLLKGNKIYKPSTTIKLLLKLYSVYGVPFNLSDYVHLIDKKE